MLPPREVMDKEPSFGVLAIAALLICCVLGLAAFWWPVLVLTVSLVVPPVFACWVGIFEARNRFVGEGTGLKT